MQLTMAGVEDTEIPARQDFSPFTWRDAREEIEWKRVSREMTVSTTTYFLSRACD